MLTFETKTPEECAIPGQAVEAMERRMECLGIHIHGYLLLSGRNIIAERYREPYGRDVMHRMYSITKSFAALAVGLLEKEGRISLDDKICRYFPEMLPEDGGHPWCLEMTIRDMLSMRTCMAPLPLSAMETETGRNPFSGWSRIMCRARSFPMTPPPPMCWRLWWKN